MSGQLCFSLHLAEEEIGRSGHSEFAHLLFVHEFDCRIPELFADHADKFGPVQESVSRSVVEGGVIVIISTPFGSILVFLAEMYPPVLGGSSE